MAFEFRYRRRVFWQDTDMAGIIHFTNYFRYMEEAETEFHRSLGFSMLKAGGGLGVWRPRVSAQCDFLRPVTFGDELDVHLKVVKKGRSSIAYEILFRHEDKEVARGRLTVACVTTSPEGGIQSTPIPPELDKVLEVAPTAE